MAGIPDGSVDAVEYDRGSIGATLKAAREHVGLTQEGLAKRLKKSQPMISGASPAWPREVLVPGQLCKRRLHRGKNGDRWRGSDEHQHSANLETIA